MDKDHKLDPAVTYHSTGLLKGLKADLMVILDLHEFTAMADDPEQKGHVSFLLETGGSQV